MLITKISPLIAPYGGQLVDLMVPAESFAERKAYASRLPSLQISPRLVCDLELLASGAFSPLDRFMSQADYERVLHDMRLADGQLFPVPVTLPVEAGSRLRLGQEIALRNNENELLAIMTIEEIYAWDRAEAAEKLYGTQDISHEMQHWGAMNISGHLQVLHIPRIFDFQDLRLTPAQTRAKLATLNRENVVAFQTHHPLYRGYEDLTRQAVQKLDGTLFLHPVVGATKLGDIDHFTRIRIYSAFAKRHYRPDQILLSLLPLVTRRAGGRELLWQALIRRNYGANHLLVENDGGQIGYSTQNAPLNNPDKAQEALEKHGPELGVKIHRLPHLPAQDRAEASFKASQETPATFFTNSHDRPPYLNNGHALPAWYAEHAGPNLLTEIYPPRFRQGLCLWFTGLSGAGKSTTAEKLTWLLLAHDRRVTVLDGDVVRTHLSKGLGFGKEDRDTNVRRIGFVAAELARLGGVVICAVVSPYRAARNDVRNMVGQDHFVEVFVDTPLGVCEARDVKGLYVKARRGELKGFTGIDDPYEPPHRPEITLDTVNYTPEENANLILKYLIEQGFILDKRR